MQKLFKTSSFIQALILGFIFLIPLIVLEVVNRRKFNENFPFAIFTFIWILQILFILLLIPMIKTLRAGKSLTAYSVFLLLRIAGLILIAYIWGGLIIDQWPCLMGVPNCD